MKWTRTELIDARNNIEFDEDVIISDDVVSNYSGIDAVENVHVSGRGYYSDENDAFYVDMHIEGVMICPDSITNEPIEYPFDTNAQETYSFTKNDDEDEVRYVSDEVDLLEAIIDNILLEVPMQVSVVDEEDYPEGEGWKVYSEKQYQEMKENEIDPRLAILKEYKEEK